MTVAPDVDYRELVAAEVRAWAARRGMTQAELADKMGVTQSWVSRRLKGGQMIDVDDLMKFAKALSVGVQDLLPRLDSNQQPFGYRAPGGRVKRRLPDLLSPTGVTIDVKGAA